ncbi:unnamed protein product [Spodoptera littoralis]|uniref:BZIP domain-containing protein n=1 Tax=Spodoptera littoralis TaxID=7109 RepID=A0A9P0HZL5_SPOLI|nr:unnamed protein product [Spodoptera littoralis]CAH1637106.1 unnamed protein product [Spodoptera littoralis]
MNSVWKPYTEVEEQAIDLSRHAVKVDRGSPLPAQSPPAVLGHMMYPIIGYPEAAVYPGTDCLSYKPIYLPASYAASTVSQVTGRSNDMSSTGDDDTESLSDDKEYQIFEQDAMRAMAAKNGGSLMCTNPRMRRAVQSSHSADDRYKEQRVKNNMAAKASRDRRKMRELKLALQASFLKKKVAELKASLATGLCRHCRQRCDC